MQIQKKFTFGESFLDAQGNVINPDMEHAKNNAYQEGHDVGYAKAKTELEADLLAMLAVLNMRMTEIVDQQKQAYTFVTDSTLAVVRTIVQKIIPEALNAYGESGLKSFVDAALNGLQDRGSVTITVHPDLQKAIDAKIKEQNQNLPEKVDIHIKSQADLERTDCIISWDDGGVENIKSKIINNIDEALDRVIHNIPTQNEGEENV